VTPKRAKEKVPSFNQEVTTLFGMWPSEKKNRKNRLSVEAFETLNKRGHEEKKTWKNKIYETKKMKKNFKNGTGAPSKKKNTPKAKREKGQNRKRGGGNGKKPVLLQSLHKDKNRFCTYQKTVPGSEFGGVTKEQKEKHTRIANKKKKFRLHPSLEKVQKGITTIPRPDFAEETTKKKLGGGYRKRFRGKMRQVGVPRTRVRGTKEPPWGCGNSAPTGKARKRRKEAARERTPDCHLKKKKETSRKKRKKNVISWVPSP